MTTCNNCGRQVSAGATICQFCGSSLLTKEGINPRLNDQEQPAIPAWLESLKASERPGTSASGSYNFSSAELVDEDALPGWMRPDSAELAKKSDSNKYPAARPAWMSAPNTDVASMGGIAPTGGLSAGSLIDSSALPSWMRPAPSSPPESFSAASLIAPESLPSWLSNQQGQTPSRPQQQTSPAPFQGFNAPASLPTPAPQFPAQANPAYPLNQGNPMGQASQGSWQQPTPLTQEGYQSGISASSLLDMQALPGWLQSPQSSQSPVHTPGQSAANGVAAGSLIDVNALPVWLRTAEQMPQSGYGLSAMQGNSGVYGTPGASGAPGHQGTSPRIESMRVPNRPRAEMAPLEQSEVAANVFSSMLGVVSNSPSYPAGSMGDYAMQQHFQSSPYQHSPVTGFAAPAAPQNAAPFTQHGEVGAQGMQGGPGAPQAYPGMQQAQAPTSMTWGGQPAQQGYQQGMNQHGQNAYATYPGAQGTGQSFTSPDPASQMYQGYGTMSGGNGIELNGGGSVGMSQTGPLAGVKPARRGFFETIREWFHI